jgi:diguanylate cyclase (GGDEF)-like protein
MSHDDSSSAPGAQAAYLQAIEADLQLARALQQALLPQQYPSFPPSVSPDESALGFYHRYHAAAALSGDFFSVQRLSDTAVGVFICDVMGHGVRPAMFTAMLRSLIEELAPLAGDPGQFLGNINYRLMTILQRAGVTLFASAFYLVADAATGEMRYANAGHPVPVLMRRKTGSVLPLPEADTASGPALGVFEEAAYPVLNYSLEVNDVVVLFTDGLVEAKGFDASSLDEAEPEDYGEERLQMALERQMNLSPPALFDAIIAGLERFSGSSEFEDDLCLVAMEVRKIGDIAPSLRDDLTGLFNHRYLEESLSREVHRAQRNGYPLSIIILAFEDFESWHRDGGEESTLLLRRVGELLLRRTRGSDMACHESNACFVLVLPEASLENASRKADQLQEAMMQISSEVSTPLAQTVVISKGVAAFPDHGATGEAVIEAAHAVLERDKNRGNGL